MTVLTTARTGFPVLRIRSKIRHSTPRRPTVFERALLRVHRQAAASGVCSGMPLSQLFEDILCVHDPQPLVQPALDALIGSGLLRCRKASHDLADVALQDLERAAECDDVLDSNMLPVRTVAEIVIHTYDPVRGRLLNARDRVTLGRDRPPLSVDDSLFRDAFPSDLIAAALPREKHRWLTAGARIEGISRLQASVLWREETGSVVLSESGEIGMTFPDQADREYVQDLPAHVILDEFIMPLLTDGSSAWQAALARTDYGALQPSVGAWFPAPQLRSRQTAAGRVAFVREIPGLVDLPGQPPSGSAVVVLNGSRESARITWNEARDGALIHVHDGSCVPETLCYANPSTALGAAMVGVRVNGAAATVPLGFCLKDEEAARVVNDALAAVEGCVAASDRADDLAVLAFWRPVSEVWDKIVSRLKQRPSEIPAALGQMLSARRTIAAVAADIAKPQWEASACELFLGSLSSCPAPIPAAALKPSVEALAACGVKDAQWSARIRDAILSKLELPKNLAEIETIVDLLTVLAGAPTAQLPPAFYTDDLLADLCSRFPEDNFQSRLKTAGPIEEAFRELKVQETSLKRSLGPDNLTLADAEERLRARAYNGDQRNPREACSRWLSLFDNLLDTAPALRAIASNTPLGRVHGEVVRFAALLEDQVRLRPQCTYVVDTSAVIDRPSIVLDAGQDARIVVPKLVIEELDAKKRDANPTVRRRAAQALRMLRDHDGPRIGYEDADPSLLPHGYGPSADNLILSVALKRRPAGPVLVTSDNDLAVKAKAEGLAVMRPDEFPAAPRQPAGVPSGQAAGPRKRTRRPASVHAAGKRR